MNAAGGALIEETERQVQEAVVVDVPVVSLSEVGEDLLHNDEKRKIIFVVLATRKLCQSNEENPIIIEKMFQLISKPEKIIRK